MFLNLIIGQRVFILMNVARFQHCKKKNFMSHQGENAGQMQNNCLLNSTGSLKDIFTAFSDI